MNIAAQLLAAGEPDALAVLAGQNELSYRELRERVNRLARALLAHGCARQDRIGIWSENSIFFVICYLAAIRAGMVAVPIQTDSSVEALTRIAEEVDLKVLLVSQRYAKQLRQALAGTQVQVADETDINTWPDDPRASFPETNAHDLAAIMFTSGSTGRAKGVMVTHRNIECNTQDIISYMRLTPSDRAMMVLPFHYCFGLSILHTHVAAGASLVINNLFLYPEKVLQELRARECTGLAGVPSTFQILLRKSRFKEMHFPHLRWLQQAGGKLPNPFIEEILTAFPAVRFYLMYGQTEGTARLSYLPPECLREKLGSIGKGLPSTRLEVLQGDGTHVRPGSDEIGEIVASGDNITPGYWNDPEETARYFRNGKLYTGDLARVDQDGFIFVVERERDMIKCGGNRVSAKEIEDAISEIPDVVEAAVVGVAHEILGETAIAFVVPCPGSAGVESAVLDHCRRSLPSFKVPERVICLRQLPHGSNGKVLKAELKRTAIAGVESSALGRSEAAKSQG